MFSTLPAANVLQLNYPISGSFNNQHSSTSTAHDVNSDKAQASNSSNTHQPALVSISGVSNSSRNTVRASAVNTNSQQATNVTNNNIAAASLANAQSITMNFSGQHTGTSIIRPQRTADGAIVNNLVSVSLNNISSTGRVTISDADGVTASGLKNARFFPVSLAARCASPATPAVLKLASTAQQLKNNAISK